MIILFSNSAANQSKATSSRAEVSNMNTLDSRGTPVPTPTITFVTWSGTWFGETVPANVSVYCRNGVAYVYREACLRGYVLDYSTYGSCGLFEKYCRPKTTLDTIFFSKASNALDDKQENEWVKRADSYCRLPSNTNNAQAKCLDYYDKKDGYKKFTVNMWGRGVECPNMRIPAVGMPTNDGIYVQPGKCYVPDSK